MISGSSGALVSHISVPILNQSDTVVPLKCVPLLQMEVVRV